MSRDWWALAGAAVCAAGLAWTARTPNEGVAWRMAFVGLSLGGSLVLVLGQRTWRPSARTVWAGALLMRLFLFPLAPTLSDDGYRYIWDGMVQVEEGESPYRWRPSDSALAAHHDEHIYQRMNSPEYYSVYPMVSQAVFAVGGLAYTYGWNVSWLVIKVVTVLAELVGIWCLFRLVAPHRVALYAWHPLAVVEVAGQGHTEGLLVGFVALSLLAAARKNSGAAAWMALAGWVKLYPLLLVPVAGHRSRPSGWWVAGLVVLAGAVPFVSGDSLLHVRQSLALYAGTFDFYSAPYLLIKSVGYPVLGEGAGRLAAAVLGMGGVCAVGALTIQCLRGALGSAQAIRTGLVALSLTATALHPWYWLGVLLIIPLLEVKYSLTWLCTLSTATYIGYAWPPAFLIATSLGWGGALILAIRSRRRREVRTPSVSTMERLQGDPTPPHSGRLPTWRDHTVGTT